MRAEVWLGHRAFLCVRLTPVNTWLNGAFWYAAIKTDTEVHLTWLQTGGDIVIDHKIGAVFIRRGNRRPLGRIVKVRVEVLRAVRHVVGHQIDVVQQRGDGLHVDPAFRAFRIGAHGNGHQLVCAKRCAQLFQQRGEIVSVSRLAGHQSPGAIYRILPIQIDTVETVFIHNFLRGADKYRTGFRRCCRA